MDSKLQPVQLYGFSKSRLYEPLGTAIFFRNRFCPVSWILVFLPVHFYGYSLKRAVLTGKIDKFEELCKKGKSSKPLSLLDFFGGEDGIRTHVRLLAN